MFPLLMTSILNLGSCGVGIFLGVLNFKHKTHKNIIMMHVFLWNVFLRRSENQNCEYIHYIKILSLNGRLTKVGSLKKKGDEQESKNLNDLEQANKFLNQKVTKSRL